MTKNNDDGEAHRALLARAKAGDKAATWQILLKYQPKITKTVGQVIYSGFGGNEALFNEIRHDTMALLYTRFPGFRGNINQLPRWIETVARNNATRILKKWQGENPVFNDDLPVQPDDEDPLQDLIDAIQAIALAGCIDRLTETHPDEAELLRLRYLQGRTVTEISEMPRFTKNPEDLCKRVTAALERVKACLDEKASL